MSKAAANPGMAQRLREARSRIFPSAAAAAEALGMKPGTIRAHENGQNGINYEDLVRYCRRYGVNVMWIITGQNEIDPPVTYEDWKPEYYEVEGTVQDGSWYQKEGDDYRGPRPKSSMHDGVEDDDGEYVAYTDERFPPDVIHAFKVRTNWSGSIYLDGTILLVVPSLYVDFRSGDHVIITRQKGEFIEISVRELVLLDPSKPLSEANVTLKAITSESPSLPGFDVVDDVEMDAFAVVIGSLSKRPVPGMTIEARKEYEEYMRKERKAS